MPIIDTSRQLARRIGSIRNHRWRIIEVVTRRREPRLSARLVSSARQKNSRRQLARGVWPAKFSRVCGIRARVAAATDTRVTADNWSLAIIPYNALETARSDALYAPYRASIGLFASRARLVALDSSSILARARLQFYFINERTGRGGGGVFSTNVMRTDSYLTARRSVSGRRRRRV